jgi:hypothetical protein
LKEFVEKMGLEPTQTRMSQLIQSCSKTLSTQTLTRRRGKNVYKSDEPPDDAFYGRSMRKSDKPRSVHLAFLEDPESS